MVTAEGWSLTGGHYGLFTGGGWSLRRVATDGWTLPGHRQEQALRSLRAAALTCPAGRASRRLLGGPGGGHGAGGGKARAAWCGPHAHGPGQARRLRTRRPPTRRGPAGSSGPARAASGAQVAPKWRLRRGAGRARWGRGLALSACSRGGGAERVGRALMVTWTRWDARPRSVLQGRQCEGTGGLRAGWVGGGFSFYFSL